MNLKSKINNYGTYTEWASKAYQNLDWLENAPPHIGSILELDKNITSHSFHERSLLDLCTRTIYAKNDKQLKDTKWNGHFYFYKYFLQSFLLDVENPKA